MPALTQSLVAVLGFLANHSSASPVKRDTYLPSSYPTPKFNQARSNIDAQAVKSVSSLSQMSDYPGGWVGENANTAVSQWDGQQGTRTFYDFIVQQENNWFANPGGCYQHWQEPGVDCYNDDGMWAGLASVQEYESYGDQTFLDRAVSIWNYIRYHGYVDQDVINAGYLQGVKESSNTVSATCADMNGNQQSMIGGVYWMNGFTPSNIDGGDEGGSSNGYINSIATGLFANLGAQLCRVTGNNTYCDYAYSSAQWLDRFTVNSDGILIDGLTGPTCELSGSTSTYSYNTGEYISAYATLGGMKSDSDAISKAQKSAKAAIVTTIWNDNQGVLDASNGPVNESSDGEEFDAILIRDLHRAYGYFVDSQLQADVLRYINIQYWSLTQVDSDSRSQPVNYGRNWNGQYSVTNGPAQTTAIDVLNALILNPDSAFPSTTDNSIPIASI